MLKNIKEVIKIITSFLCGDMLGYKSIKNEQQS